MKILKNDKVNSEDKKNQVENKEIFLDDENLSYCSKCDDIVLQKVNEFLPNDLALYHIEELTFEEKAPRKEALENIISALRFKGINFLYLVIGDNRGVHFYLGAVRDLNYKKELDMELYDVGSEILQPSINGNFRGSKVVELSARDKFDISKKISSMRVFGTIEGVPGIDEKSEDFQGVDRLVDVMLGDEFVIGVIASPIDRERVKEIENSIYEIYDRITPLSKKSIQESTGISRSISRSEGTSKNTNKGTSTGTSDSTGISSGDSTSKGSSSTKTTGTNLSFSKSDGTNSSTNTGKNTSKSSTSEGSSSSTSTSGGTSSGSSRGSNSSESQSKGENASLSEATNIGTSTNKGVNSSKSTSKSTNTGTSEGTSSSISSNDGDNTGTSINLEYSKKVYQEWIKYFDEILLPRLDYGKSKGIFVMNTFIATNNRASLIKLGNTMKSLYSGKSGNKVPLEIFEVTDEVQIDNMKKFQVPVGIIENQSKDMKLVKSALSQDLSDNYIKVGNVVSTNELSLIAGLPQKEVVGLELKEQVEFGLNVKSIKDECNKIELGNLVQSGRVLDLEVNLDKSNLNKHTFITGVTGSGKTTTCQRIIMEANMPFMVIEPAKTEYRILTQEFDDLLIFTLGRDNIAPFRINPFEFYPHENISSRVDMIKATLEAAFDMEAAIPQIIESAIYECYENYGWNIATNENENYENPFADGVFTFPTLSDLLVQVERNINNQGFDDRLKNDYIGSIRARLQGLMIGSKGLMLNCKRSVDFKELVNRRVILELEEIRNASEKSLLMGFVLTNLNEAIKACYLENTDFKHMTLVEEAHRLLSKYTAGDSMSKKQGVEAFSDMLAEVRKYGESLIIVDQIPDKLTPEVLKNTNTKIVHKIFAADDKKAIGNTMALKEDQMDFMSNLQTGRAIIFSQGYEKAVQVQVKMVTNTTSKEIISEDVIRDNILEFYKSHYKAGVLEGLEFLESEPSLDEVRAHLRFLQSGRLVKEFRLMIQNKKTEFDFKEYIENLGEFYSIDFVSSYIAKNLYKEDKENGEYISKRIEAVKANLQAFIDEKIILDKSINDFYFRYLNIK